MPVPRQGDIIRAALEREAISQAEFSRQMELPQPYVNRIVNNKETMPYTRVIEAGKILGIDPDVLFVVAGQLPPDIEPIILQHPKLIKTIRNHGHLMTMKGKEAKGLYRTTKAGTM